MAEKEKPNGKHPFNPTELFQNVVVKPSQWPIVYRPEYNIGFFGLEKFHPFDAGKWGRVYEILKKTGMIRDETTVRPAEATEQDLQLVHSREYIKSLTWSANVARITEVLPVMFLPNSVVQGRVLRPMRYQTGGTVLAAKLAMERGWAINIGGGFHHSSADRGGGFCAYADITLAIKFLFQTNPCVKKAMIVDLDAHQGNGHERDFMNDGRVYIMDVFNRDLYPHDGYAKRNIKKRVELSHGVADAEYLNLVEKNLNDALEEFTPDIIVYNAGTDVLAGDPLGHLNISPEGIIMRDEIVFKTARSKKIPVVMVTSGGYQKSTAQIIANSILNLKEKKLIECKDIAEPAVAPESVPTSATPPTSLKGHSHM